MIRLVLSCLALVLVACGSFSAIYTKGIVGQRPLITHVYESSEKVGQECLNPAALGCRVLYWENKTGYCRIILRNDLAKDKEREVIVHESCHCVAGLNRIPDPCHNEDEGVIHVR